MLESKVYRKYYPLKNYTDLYFLDKRELHEIVKWIKNI